MEYKLVLENFENEEDRKHSLKQLQLLLGDINRPAESAKFAKELATGATA